MKIMTYYEKATAARRIRKNRVRQLKHTIARLTALLRMRSSLEKAWHEVFSDAFIGTDMAKTRAARWKAAAKKWRKADMATWEMHQKTLSIALNEQAKIQEELEETDYLLKAALKWRAHWKKMYDRVMKHAPHAEKCRIQMIDEHVMVDTEEYGCFHAGWIDNEKLRVSTYAAQHETFTPSILRALADFIEATQKGGQA